MSQWEYEVCWTLNVENIIAVKLPTMMIAFTFNDDDSSKTVYSTLIISHSDFKMLWVRREKNHKYQTLLDAYENNDGLMPFVILLTISVSLSFCFSAFFVVFHIVFIVSISYMKCSFSPFQNWSEFIYVLNIFTRKHTEMLIAECGLVGIFNTFNC